MPINIDKIIESLPENLTFHADSCRITSNQDIVPNFIWGPFDVNKTPADLNQAQAWLNLKVLNAEWVNVLIKETTERLFKGTNLPASDNEDGNVKVSLNRKDLQITVSTNEDIDGGNELKCKLVILDHLPNKLSTHMDSSTEIDQTTEKMSKTCKFCGINFSHQCTLDAHMIYYCSKRQTLSTECNPSPKCQKTWRTRQRNKQSNSQKVNPSFNANLFSDETNKNSSSKLLLSAINGSEVQQMEKQLNLSSVPIVQANPLGHKKNILTNGSSIHLHNLKHGDSDKLSNKPANGSDSEHENGNMSTLGFCAPCGLFFSSKELYNIHIQLDLTSLQSSIEKCNSLVLAAPVFNNNGLQYVPIHPRTTMITTPTNLAQKATKPVSLDDQSALIPLDLSINNSSKSPTNEVANRIAAAAAGLANSVLRSNKRPFLCQHCQTRFQLYSTFQAHQEFYCQGKRQQTEISGKRCRTASNTSCQNEFDRSPTLKSDDNNWKLCSQGFKCDGCGFIGQTQRGIRIHCKNQCFKRFKNQKSDANCDEVEVHSPTSDVWAAASNNATVALESPELSEFCHQDSPIKIESV